MPEAEIAARGGAVRVRTQKLSSSGRYRHIYVVRKAGPHGGHTVAGEVRRTKRESPTTRGTGPRVEPDDQPSYRIKPRRPDTEKVKKRVTKG